MRTTGKRWGLLSSQIQRSRMTNNLMHLVGDEFPDDLMERLVGRVV